MADKILIVDDDQELREELKEALDDYEVIDVSGGQAALQGKGQSRDSQSIA